MISELKIERFRGIETGVLKDLTDLTVLVGRNGCGKSTVLEALAITVGPSPVPELDMINTRYGLESTGLSWLFWQNNRQAVDVKIEVVSSLENSRIARLNYSSQKSQVQFYLYQPGVDELLLANYNVGQGSTQQELTHPVFDQIENLHGVWTKEPARGEYLAKTLTEAIRLGRRPILKAFISAILPGATQLETVTDVDNRPNLDIGFDDYSVPLDLTGTGIRAAVQTALELAVTGRGGLLLLEEPETHLHPGAMKLVAQVIWEAIRRGVRIVLTTHSLEFIDQILYEADESDMDRLSVHRLALNEGCLKVSRFAGEDVAFARNNIQDDLR